MQCIFGYCYKYTPVTGFVVQGHIFDSTEKNKLFKYYILTSPLDFWEDLSRTSSQERSESSEKLRFLLRLKSTSEN